jgi:hypothetical protein
VRGRPHRLWHLVRSWQQSVNPTRKPFGQCAPHENVPLHRREAPPFLFMPACPLLPADLPPPSLLTLFKGSPSRWRTSTRTNPRPPPFGSSPPPSGCVSPKKQMHTLAPWITSLAAGNGVSRSSARPCQSHALNSPQSPPPLTPCPPPSPR